MNSLYVKEVGGREQKDLSSHHCIFMDLWISKGKLLFTKFLLPGLNSLAY